jgi:hypothetical protein
MLDGVAPFTIDGQPALYETSAFRVGALAGLGSAVRDQEGQSPCRQLAAE